MISTQAAARCKVERRRDRPADGALPATREPPPRRRGRRRAAARRRRAPTVVPVLLAFERVPARVVGRLLGRAQLGRDARRRRRAPRRRVGGPRRLGSEEQGQARRGRLRPRRDRRAALRPPRPVGRARRPRARAGVERRSRFHAIDATLSQWPRRLDGVEAHKGPPQYFSLVDFPTGRRTRSTRTATRTGRRRRLRGPAPGRTSERSAYKGCGGLMYHIVQQNLSRMPPRKIIDRRLDRGARELRRRGDGERPRRPALLLQAAI